MQRSYIILSSWHTANTLLMLLIFERCICLKIFFLKICHLLSFGTRSGSSLGWVIQGFWCVCSNFLALFILFILYLLVAFTLSALVAISWSPISVSVVVRFIRVFLYRRFICILLGPAVILKYDSVCRWTLLVTNISQWFFGCTWWLFRSQVLNVFVC